MKIAMAFICTVSFAWAQPERILKKEIHCADGTVFSLCNIRLPDPATGEMRLQDELTLTAPGVQNAHWLIHEGGLRHITDVSGGYREFYSAITDGKQAELLLADHYFNIALLQFKQVDGAWRRDGNVSVLRVSDVKQPKLVGFGHIEGEQNGQKVIFRVAPDGVITRNGELYQPPNTEVTIHGDAAAMYRDTYMRSKLVAKIDLEHKNIPRLVTTEAGAKTSQSSPAKDGMGQVKATPPAIRPPPTNQPSTPLSAGNGGKHTGDISGDTRLPWIVLGGLAFLGVVIWALKKMRDR